MFYRDRRRSRSHVHCIYTSTDASLNFQHSTFHVSKERTGSRTRSFSYGYLRRFRLALSRDHQHFMTDLGSSARSSHPPPVMTPRPSLIYISERVIILRRRASVPFMQVRYRSAGFVRWSLILGRSKRRIFNRLNFKRLLQGERVLFTRDHFDSGKCKRFEVARYKQIDVR